MGSPIDEKAQLPCIMITPSSPTHEYDYQIHYFQPAKQQPGFFSCVRQAFSSSRGSYIALPDSPNPNYPVTTNQRSTTSGWSVSKRFRAVLLLAACLFFMLHLCVLPKVDTGLYDALTAHAGSQQTDDAVALWEVVPGTEGTSTPASEPETTGLAFDADDTVAGSLV